MAIYKNSASEKTKGMSYKATLFPELGHHYDADGGFVGDISIVLFCNLKKKLISNKPVAGSRERNVRSHLYKIGEVANYFPTQTISDQTALAIAAKSR